MTSFFGSLVNNAVQDGIASVKSTATNAILRQTQRLAGSGLARGGERLTPPPAQGKFNNQDWRVRISLPIGSDLSYDGALLAPLAKTGGMIFPYTPTVMVSHTATYSATSPTHSNYAQHFFGNSSVDAITVTGEFTAQNQEEALYLQAVLHYMRTVTKMFWGNDPDAGSPPPVLRLNGYGENIFKNVPVVVTNFTFELPNSVDYISTGDTLAGNTKVPTQTNVSVTMSPIYSRSQLSTFSLDDFAKGGSLLNDNGFI